MGKHAPPQRYSRQKGKLKINEKGLQRQQNATATELPRPAKMMLSEAKGKDQLGGARHGCTTFIRTALSKATSSLADLRMHQWFVILYNSRLQVSRFHLWHEATLYGTHILNLPVLSMMQLIFCDLQKVAEHTKTIQLTNEVLVANPHLLHLWEARRGLIRCSKKQKCNRTLKIMVAKITEEARVYADTLFTHALDKLMPYAGLT